MPESPIETVRAVALLARLDIKPEETEVFARQFASILSQFEALARHDVSGVEPMVSGAGATHLLRADEPRACLSTDDALANAPARVDAFYEVPKTVGGEE